MPALRRKGRTRLHNPKEDHPRGRMVKTFVYLALTMYLLKQVSPIIYEQYLKRIGGNCLSGILFLRRICSCFIPRELGGSFCSSQVA